MIGFKGDSQGVHLFHRFPPGDPSPVSLSGHAAALEFQLHYKQPESEPRAILCSQLETTVNPSNLSICELCFEELLLCSSHLQLILDIAVRLSLL